MGRERERERKIEREIDIEREREGDGVKERQTRRSDRERDIDREGERQHTFALCYIRTHHRFTAGKCCGHAGRDAGRGAGCGRVGAAPSEPVYRLPSSAEISSREGLDGVGLKIRGPATISTRYAPKEIQPGGLPCGPA